MSMTIPESMRPTWRRTVSSLLRVLLAVVVVLGAYAVAPVRIEGAWGRAGLLVGSLIIFGAVLVWQVLATWHSPHPVVRGMEALGVTITFFLCLFALQYLGEYQLNSTAFTEPLDKFTSLYYTVVVFATVGFGDITPTSTAARAITMVQMLGGLVFIGVGIKVLAGAARESMDRRIKEQ